MTGVAITGMFLALLALSPVAHRGLAESNTALAVGAAVAFTVLLFALAFLSAAQ